VFVPATSGVTPFADVTIASASPAIGEADLDAIAACWSKARADGRRIHARAGTATSSRGDVAELGRRGLLGTDVTLSHCTHLNDADFDAIAASTTAVALTPASDMAAGMPLPPVQQLIDRGIRPGLGIGDEQLTPGDIFAQMRSVISVQHAASFDLKLAGKGSVPNLLDTRDVIRYATVEGARAVGFEAVTGSLTPGKRADVIVLRADTPNIAPVNDPIGAVVWGMDTSNVDWVFVGGTSLVANGELSGDVARARRLASAAQQHVGAARS
jgi:5-methylthioadenosine/S-adenosylhomocysteine deaminase